jgi:uncharacterized coiled-coil protein SlyX
MSDDETRIADLENEIKHRDRRILELKREVDEAQMLIAEMREQVQDCSDQTERFIEAFDMVLATTGRIGGRPSSPNSTNWRINTMRSWPNGTAWCRSTTPPWRRVVSAARSPQAKLSNAKCWSCAKRESPFAS